MTRPAPAALLLAALAAPPAAAAPFGGVDWVPSGLGDAAWLDAGMESGTLVAEHDGLLVPPLRAWAGAAGRRYALTGGLAVARITTTTVTGSGDDRQVTVNHVGALRPSVDARRYLRDREAGRPVPYVLLGLYGVIPSARYRSDAYDEAEQADWDDVARADRARIAAAGGRLGVGAELPLPSGLLVGARYAVVLHRGQVVDDEAWRASVLVLGEAALTLGFDFR